MDPMASHIADGCGFHLCLLLVDRVIWVDLASEIQFEGVFFFFFLGQFEGVEKVLF